MAIKKLRFSFDVPITDLLGLIATRNEALQIDVVTDNKPVKQLRNGAAGIAGLLEGPTGSRRGMKMSRGADTNGHKITGYEALAAAILAKPDHSFKPVELQPVLEAVGLNGKSVSPQLSLMKKKGHIKKNDETGGYKMTPQGARHFLKLAKDRENHPKGDGE